MSGLYEALKRAEKEEKGLRNTAAASQPTEVLKSLITDPVDLGGIPSVPLKVPPTSRLVTLTEPQSLGAEKFRALVTRLENIRFQRELKALQITSSVVGEGKSLVAANLAIAIAKLSGSKVLLVDGDLHRPTLASLFGLNQSPGISEWWSGEDDEIVTVLRRLDKLPLWFLASGKSHGQPSDILQSPRLAKVFAKLAGSFDWVVVDSTPMLPVVDVNLWSRLVDGTLLVVREGVAPVKALEKGLEGLDSPKLIGVVLNEASEFNRGNYKYSYYGYKR